MAQIVNYSYLNSVKPKYSDPTKNYYKLFGSSIIRKDYEKTGTTSTTEKKQSKTFEQIVEEITNQGFERNFNDFRNEETSENRTEKSASSQNLLSVKSISGRTRNKIKNKLFSWFHAVENIGLTFVTLTFINDVDDKTSVKVLNNWLTKLRKKEGKFSYLWVIERQHKNNGRIHFHMVTSKFWNVYQANEDWINYQLESGIKHEFKTISKFTKKGAPVINQNTGRNEWKSLNPFQAEHVKEIEGLTKYLNKYVTKNEDSFECAVWHCSRDISQLFTGYRSNTTDLDMLLNDKRTFSYYNRKKCAEVYLGAFETDFAIIYPNLNPHLYLNRFEEVYNFNRYILENQPKKTDIIHSVPIYQFTYKELI